MGIFASNIRYRFEIENTGDAIPDLFLDVTYPLVWATHHSNRTIKLTDPNG